MGEHSGLAGGGEGIVWAFCICGCVRMHECGRVLVCERACAFTQAGLKCEYLCMYWFCFPSEMAQIVQFVCPCMGSCVCVTCVWWCVCVCVCMCVVVWLGY